MSSDPLENAWKLCAVYAKASIDAVMSQTKCENKETAVTVRYLVVQTLIGSLLRELVAITDDPVEEKKMLDKTYQKVCKIRQDKTESN